MKSLLFPSLLALSLGAAAQAQSATVVVQPNVSLGLRSLEYGVSAGYAGGISAEGFVHAPNVLGPIGVKLSAAYTAPSDSIRDDVAITGAGTDAPILESTFGYYKTNFGATETGRHITTALDGTYNFGPVSRNLNLMGYAGARYGMFSASESYDAASTTTTSMNAFGIGAGAMLSYPIGNRLSLIGDVGVDQYFNGALNSVKTGGNSSADTIATSDALYASQRARFAFPGTVFKVKVGVKVGN